MLIAHLEDTDKSDRLKEVYLLALYQHLSQVPVEHHVECLPFESRP